MTQQYSYEPTETRAEADGGQTEAKATFTAPPPLLPPEVDDQPHEASAPYEQLVLNPVQHGLEVEPVVVTPTIRDGNSMTIANMGTDSRAHFLVHKDGQELCGSCGQAFPCSQYVDVIMPRNTAASTGEQPDAELEAKVTAVMSLLQVSEEQARRMLNETGMVR